MADWFADWLGTHYNWLSEFKLRLKLNKLI